MNVFELAEKIDEDHRARLHAARVALRERVSAAYADPDIDPSELQRALDGRDTDRKLVSWCVEACRNPTFITCLLNPTDHRLLLERIQKTVVATFLGRVDKIAIGGEAMGVAPTAISNILYARRRWTQWRAFLQSFHPRWRDVPEDASDSRALQSWSRKVGKEYELPGSMSNTHFELVRAFFLNSAQVFPPYVYDEALVIDNLGIESTAALVGGLKAGWAAIPVTLTPEIALDFDDNPYASIFP
jgi:hypothetical protein